MQWIYRTPGIPDALFVRGNVPMTKEEVRAVTISKLRLKEDSIVVDVGAGTGSIAIEAAHICKKGLVIAIERNREGIALIRKNQEKFGVNLKILHGNGSSCLKEIDKIDRIIIGGSGGELREILKLGYQKLLSEGICVLNCITIETLADANRFMKEVGFKDIEVVSVNVARGKSAGNYTLMEALNPVHIVSGRKG